MGGVNCPNVASFTIWWFYNSEFYCKRTPDPSEVVGPETKMVDTGTLTRADLAEMLNRQIGLSRADSAAMIESILDHMTAALLGGDNVKISGFGTFVLRDKGQRIGRNPKTGIEVPITPRRVLTFRASRGMQQKVK